MLKVIIAVLFVSQISAISVQDCGSQSIKLIKFATSDNKVRSNSILELTSHFDILNEIDSPVNLELVVKRKVWFAWVKVPCVSQLGSCTFENGCEKLREVIAGKDCPPGLVESGISCSCPLKEGSVRLDNHPIQFPDLGGIFGALATGNYQVRAKLVNPITGQVHVCVNVEAEVV